ncbi:hypothetical protein [Paenibacillus glacialis]|uniref:Uncharacterized protein n=1 Tax=Paenibacillus glacialis TaxID=494026 RepID=A0A168C1F4_9BACL|nr:hypothetical protein [Paenibacillus glacialis]OAB32962.1 hypothetical protein PGLA_26135 [Paenibacillus glacialis]
MRKKFTVGLLMLVFMFSLATSAFADPPYKQIITGYHSGGHIYLSGDFRVDGATTSATESVIALLSYYNPSTGNWLGISYNQFSIIQNETTSQYVRLVTSYPAITHPSGTYKVEIIGTPFKTWTINANIVSSWQ